MVAEDGRTSGEELSDTLDINLDGELTPLTHTESLVRKANIALNLYYRKQTEENKIDVLLAYENLGKDLYMYLAEYCNEETMDHRRPLSTFLKSLERETILRKKPEYDRFLVMYALGVGALLGTEKRDDTPEEEQHKPGSDYVPNIAKLEYRDIQTLSRTIAKSGRHEDIITIIDLLNA